MITTKYSNNLYAMKMYFCQFKCCRVYQLTHIFCTPHGPITLCMLLALNFGLFLLKGNLLNLYIFHPFSITPISSLCILCIFRYLILILQFLEVFMKIEFQVQFWIESEIPIIAIWMTCLQYTWARVGCMNGNLGN